MYNYLSFQKKKKNGSNQVFNNRKMIKPIKESPGDGVLWSALKSEKF